MVHAGGGVCALDSAGRGGHGALPFACAGELRREDYAAREVELPEIYVVQQPVFVRGHGRCERGEGRSSAEL